MKQQAPAVSGRITRLDTDRTNGSGKFDMKEDAEQFALFLEGDNEAFLRLFRKYNQRIHLYCLKFIGDVAVAEDLAQEMWERLIELRGNPQQVLNPTGFLFRIARNLCLDHLKRQRKIVSLDDVREADHPTTSEHEPTDLEELVLATLDRLPVEQREVLILNLYCGYRFDEIAEMLGNTPEAVWARASRARAQLRKMVAAGIGVADRTRSNEAPNSSIDPNEKDKQ